jgi:hypothetical protein
MRSPSLRLSAGRLQSERVVARSEGLPARSNSQTARSSRLPVAPVFVVMAVVVLCGFTLYWTQTRLLTMSTRLHGLERSLQAAVTQQQSPQTPTQTSGSSSAMATDTQPSQTGPVRLARIAGCVEEGNIVTITYDPAQLFTGSDAVKLAASNGDAVTGDTYIFDPTRDVFQASSPIKTTVTVHVTPAGWTGPLPATIAELAGAIQSPGGEVWLGQYFWLHFNEDYIVSIEQLQTTATP